MVGRCKRSPAADRSHHILDTGGLSPKLEDREQGGGEKDPTCSMYGGEKVYAGVRVKMPVKELLKNLRISRGQDSPALKTSGHRKNTGHLKRARSKNQTIRVRRIKKSLEELETILEVLEEDLRSSSSYPSSPPNLSLPSCSPPSHAELSPAGYSDEYDDVIPSPEAYLTSSPDYVQALSPPDCFCSFQTSNCMSKDEWFDLQNQNLNSSTFFWKQLQKEEVQLRDVSDGDLLATDEQHRTALHRAVFMGKRALVYTIAARMAALNGLDLKDSDGMTALLYAAKQNQHLMVADLIGLGANINETNNWGKSCLHLSAENGYIRVLEVLKQAMMDGVYIDVEATDNSGMSVLQCVSVALKNSVCEVESSNSPSHTRLQTLRQEQMMESLECLLQMDSYLLTTPYRPRPDELEFTAQPWLSCQRVCLEGHFPTSTLRICKTRETVLRKKSGEKPIPHLDASRNSTSQRRPVKLSPACGYTVSLS